MKSSGAPVIDKIRGARAQGKLVADTTTGFANRDLMPRLRRQKKDPNHRARWASQRRRAVRSARDARQGCICRASGFVPGPVLFSIGSMPSHSAHRRAPRDSDGPIPQLQRPFVAREYDVGRLTPAGASLFGKATIAAGTASCGPRQTSIVVKPHQSSHVFQSGAAREMSDFSASRSHRAAGPGHRDRWCAA